jgi:hypothetical protein
MGGVIVECGMEWTSSVKAFFSEYNQRLEITVRGFQARVFRVRMIGNTTV